MAALRVRILQHVPFEDIGGMRGWLDRRGAHVEYTRFHAGDVLPPEASALDLLIAMGGPMSVNDEHRFPWLKPEKAFVRDAINRGVPVLGICLGAQLIASALGARVHPNVHREIGWFPVRAVEAPEGAFRFPAQALVFHWHGETFELPPRASRLAESVGCRIQAFQVGRHVLGLQFHPEMTMSGACLLIEHCPDDLAPGAYVQREQDMLNTDAAAYHDGHALMDRVLEYLTAAKVVGA